MRRYDKGLKTQVEDFSSPPEGYEDFLLHQFYWLTKTHLECEKDATIVGDWIGKRMPEEESGAPEVPSPSDPDYIDKLLDYAQRFAEREIDSIYEPGSMYNSVLSEMWLLPVRGDRLRPDTNIEHLSALVKLSGFYAACPFTDDNTFRGLVQIARMTNTKIQELGGKDWNTPKVANEIHEEFPGMARASRVKPYRVHFEDAKAMALSIFGDTPTTRQQIELMQAMMDEADWEDEAAEDLLEKGYKIDLKQGNLSIARGREGNVIIEKKSERKTGTGGGLVRAKPSLGETERDAGEVTDSREFTSSGSKEKRYPTTGRF